MRQFEPIMSEQSDILVKQIACSGPEPVNMTTVLKRSTVDVVALLAFEYHMR